MSLSAVAELCGPQVSRRHVSRLFEATAGLENPLTGARVTLLGRARPSADELDRQRFLHRHPEAERYAGFKDFALFRVVPERAGLTA